jgi:CCR4-NOT transcription complex subunit 1
LIFDLGSLPPHTSLVQILIQLGPDNTSDSEAVRGLLERFGITAASPPRDGQVTEVISALARLAAEGSVICDVGSLVRAFASYVCL